MHRWIVFWYGPLLRHWEVDHYASEREARRVARKYAAQYPYNSYSVARVFLQIDATETWTPPGADVTYSNVRMTEKKDAE